MDSKDPHLVASSWTSAGDASPLRGTWLSPLNVQERVLQVASAGFHGIGLSHDDLRLARDTIGFGRLERLIREEGLVHTEVEFSTAWASGPRAGDHELETLLFDAAAHLGAEFVKVGTPTGAPVATVSLVAPLQALADRAAEHGVSVALEPAPFTWASSVPDGSRLVAAVDRANCGLVVDAWHVFRGGTDLADLARCLRPQQLFGVELNDGGAQPRGSLIEDSANCRLLCGRGTFDLEGLIRTIAAVGYEGAWGIEILSDEHRALDPGRALNLAFASGQRILRRSGVFPESSE